jgi:hypothetical protein
MSDINPVSTPSIDVVGDWAEKDRQHGALAKAIRPTNKAALFTALANAGITTVVVQFDGYGDSGQVETIEARRGETAVELPDTQIELAIARWGKADADRSMLPIREAVEQLAYDFLGETHAGWENNEGAYGEFIFDVAARTITLDYNERITDTDYSQHVF